MYRYVEKDNCIEIVDEHNNFVESFDFNELSEVIGYVRELNEPKKYHYELLLAKGKWVTRDRKKILVPIEEFTCHFGKVTALTRDLAKSKVYRHYRDKEHIVRELKIWRENCERQ